MDSLLFITCGKYYREKKNKTQCLNHNFAKIKYLMNLTKVVYYCLLNNITLHDATTAFKISLKASPPKTPHFLVEVPN